MEAKKRRRPRNGTGKVRTSSYTYYLIDKIGEDYEVCQLFMIHTLGFTSNKKFFHLLQNVLSSDIASPQDKRGRQPTANKLREETLKLIEDHINSQNPAISHYRRKHAPNRRYITSELNATLMFNDFREQFPDIKVSYTFYLEKLKKMNISFSKLGEEECEQCVEYGVHIKRDEYEKGQSKIVNSLLTSIVNQVECDVDGCTICAEYRDHQQKQNIARFEYKKDLNLYKPTNGEIVAAVDMQKVIMLPRMPGIKKAIFTKRLTTFHMTFAPLGGRGRDGKPIGIIWNESISGRHDEDVTSTYIKYITDCMRNRTQVTIWADNCSAQNKNWTLFTALVQLVNDESKICEKVTIKYFEPGHTWMAADSFHRSVEQVMKRRKTVFDFREFEDVINDANGVAVKMSFSDFRNYKSKLSHASTTNYPRLENIVVVEFRKGCSWMFWKEDMRLVEFQQGEFLQKKFVKTMTQEEFNARSYPRGIPESKKKNILSKLCPMMDKQYQQFWMNIPTNDVEDLVDMQ